MPVKVKFFGEYRQKFSLKEIILNLNENSTVKGILLMIDNHYNKKIGSTILEDLKRKPNMIIMVNGRHIKLLNGIETKVKDGDVISIFPPAGGG